MGGIPLVGPIFKFRFTIFETPFEIIYGIVYKQHRLSKCKSIQVHFFLNFIEYKILEL
jgi:hypothetical protein